jgi:predicted dehydrogenase
MSDVMRIGLWGCGNMGRSLARALVASDEAVLVAAYDLANEAVSSVTEQYGACAAPSAEALLSHPGLDGVIVALPSDLHAPAVVQAAEVGLGIFVEKPMSLTVAGCREMLNAVARCGVVMMVGHVLRYYEPYRSIRRWRDEGRFGDLYAASMWRVIDGRRIKAGNWRASRARSGGYLFEVSVHELDMLRCLMGRPRSVCAISQKRLPQEGEWTDHIALQIRFEDGRAASYEGGTGSHVGRYGFRFYFEGATLISDAAFDRTALHVYGPGGERIEIEAEEFSTEHPVEAELRGWLAALRGEAPVPISGEQGMASIALVEAAYRAAESGQIVEYDPEGGIR